MKRIGFLLLALFLCFHSFAETVNIEWYVDGNIYTTSNCEAGGNVTPPTPPLKNGYTFQRWVAYTPIEYLESNGRQYIDTGFQPNGKTSVEIEAQFLNVSSLNWIFGSRQANTNIFSLGVNPSINQYIFGYAKSIGNGQTSSPTPDTQKHLFKLDKGDFYIDQTVYKNSIQNFECPYNMYLFSLNYNGGASISSARIYSVKIYDDGVLIRDYVPALDSNDVPCMLDVVNYEFYYSATNNDFIAGPVIGGE